MADKNYGAVTITSQPSGSADHSEVFEGHCDGRRLFCAVCGRFYPFGLCCTCCGCLASWCVISDDTSCANTALATCAMTLLGCAAPCLCCCVGCLYGQQVVSSWRLELTSDKIIFSLNSCLTEGICISYEINLRDIRSIKLCPVPKSPACCACISGSGDKIRIELSPHHDSDTRSYLKRWSDAFWCGSSLCNFICTKVCGFEDCCTCGETFHSVEITYCKNADEFVAKVEERMRFLAQGEAEQRQQSGLDREDKPHAARSCSCGQDQATRSRSWIIHSD